VDFACGGSHKWMTSPVGVGFLISKMEHVGKLKPVTIGMATYGTCEDTSALACVYKRDAHVFESGSRQVLEITALGASAEFIIKTGVENIQKESERLGLKLREGLQDLGYNLHHNANSSGAFVTLTHKEVSPKVLGSHLRQHNISFAYRGPGLRLSCHAHNDDSDLQKALDVFKTIKK
jgi:selenocysteine lyase/cysteine desulfurase